VIGRAPSVGSTTTPIALAGILSVLFSVSAEAAPITIVWNPSSDPTVIGYQVYVGATSGSYTETFDVGLATSFSYFPTEGSVYHYFAIAAYAAGPVRGPLSYEVSTDPRANENYWSFLWAIRAQTMQRSIQSLTWNRDPAITITVPTSRDSYSTERSFVTIGGTATDDGVVTEVTWTTDRGHQGRATGTDNWIAGIPLQRGKNTITIRARDEEGNDANRSIVVNFVPRRSFSPRQ
jgi:hypothetical protein